MPLTITRRGVAAGVLVLVIAAVCVRLGFWQLDRLEQRRADNATLTRTLSRPVQSLDSVAARKLAADPESFLNRRVTISGSYIPGAEILLRGRARNGRPGVHLVAPFHIQSTDAAILVNRGWLPAPDAASADPRPYAATGQLEISGIVKPIEAHDEEPVPAELDVNGTKVSTFQRLDTRLLQSRSPHRLLPVVFQQLTDPEPTAPPYPVEIPELDEGPHLGYAFQWFSFAVIAVVGFLVMVLRRGSQGS
ncbi:MAG TPA: SURF1 family protein [Longimicrobiaceae bacterium]|nr:SURF1 family protein [Longimicrobiaceae bacterium]